MNSLSKDRRREITMNFSRKYRENGCSGYSWQMMPYGQQAMVVHLIPDCNFDTLPSEFEGVEILYKKDSREKTELMDKIGEFYRSQREADHEIIQEFIDKYEHELIYGWSGGTDVDGKHHITVMVDEKYDQSLLPKEYKGFSVEIRTGDIPVVA